MDRTGRIVRTARRRMTAASVIDGAGRGLVWGACAAIAIVGASKFWIMPMGWWWFGGASILAGGSAGALWALRRQRTLLHVAGEIDRRLRLKDRLSTGTAIAAPEHGSGAFERLAVEEADRTSSGIEVRRAAPIIWGRSWRTWPVVAAGAAALGLWMPHLDVTGREAKKASDVAARAAVARRLAEASPRSRSDSTQPSDPFGPRRTDNKDNVLRDIERELASGKLDPAQAAQKGASELTRLAGEREETAQEARRSADSLRDTLARLQPRDSNAESAAPPSALDDAMRSGDLASAAKAAREMLNTEPSLSPESKARAAKELETLARDLRDAERARREAQSEPGESKPGAAPNELPEGSNLPNADTNTRDQTPASSERPRDSVSDRPNEPTPSDDLARAIENAARDLNAPTQPAPPESAPPSGQRPENSATPRPRKDDAPASSERPSSKGEASKPEDQKPHGKDARNGAAPSQPDAPTSKPNSERENRPDHGESSDHRNTSGQPQDPSAKTPESKPGANSSDQQNSHTPNGDSKPGAQDRHQASETNQQRADKPDASKSSSSPTPSSGQNGERQDSGAKEERSDKNDSSKKQDKSSDSPESKSSPSSSSQQNGEKQNADPKSSASDHTPSDGTNHQQGDKPDAAKPQPSNTGSPDHGREPQSAGTKGEHSEKKDGSAPPDQAHPASSEAQPANNPSVQKDPSTEKTAEGQAQPSNAPKSDQGGTSKPDHAPEDGGSPRPSPSPRSGDPSKPSPTGSEPAPKLPTESGKPRDPSDPKNQSGAAKPESPNAADPKGKKGPAPDPSATPKDDNEQPSPTPRTATEPQPQTDPTRKGTDPSAKDPQAQPDPGNPAKPPSTEGLRQLADQLKKLADQPKDAAAARKQAEDMRRQAQELLKNASPEEREQMKKWGQDFARDLKQNRGNASGADQKPDPTTPPIAGQSDDPTHSRGEEGGPNGPGSRNQARTPQSHPFARTEPMDARPQTPPTPAERAGKLPDHVIAEWYANKKPDRSDPAAAPLTPDAEEAVRQAVAGGERAVDNESVPMRYDTLLRKYFQRLGDRAKAAPAPAQDAPASPARPAVPAQDAPTRPPASAPAKP